MKFSTIKSTYQKHINDRTRNILRWTLLIGITTYLIVSATPGEDIMERSTIMNVIFWILNGTLMLIVTINMILSIYAAIRRADKKNISNALCSIVLALLLLLFVMDIYNHNVFYTIKHTLINIWV